MNRVCKRFEIVRETSRTAPRDDAVGGSLRRRIIGGSLVGEKSAFLGPSGPEVPVP